MYSDELYMHLEATLKNRNQYKPNVDAPFKLRLEIELNIKKYRINSREFKENVTDDAHVKRIAEQ